MRIDRIEIINFKGFAHLELELDAHFTLLMGNNGAGKTSILDALGVAAGIWLVGVPARSWRNIATHEIRRCPIQIGDTVRFAPEPFAEITATGVIAGKQTTWKRQIRKGGTRTTNADAKEALDILRRLVKREEELPSSVVLPVLAYYSAARLGQPSNHRPSKTSDGKTGRERLEAYYHCLDGSVRHERLNEWFLWAAVAAGQGQRRAGHDAVIEAVMKCLPGCRKIWFDSERKEIVADLGGTPVPYYSLSAGQQMTLAMAADIAIKAETLNPQLGAKMVKETPGIVLIDELDVHLHPTWQRRVVGDLRAAFPCIQFVCTSHSPQIFGELLPGNILVCDPGSNEWRHPIRSFGMDSSRVLDEEMDASSRSETLRKQISTLADAVDKEDFQEAESLLNQVEESLGIDDPEVTRVRTLIAFLQETK